MKNKQSEKRDLEYVKSSRTYKASVSGTANDLKYVANLDDISDKEPPEIFSIHRAPPTSENESYRAPLISNSGKDIWSGEW